MPLPKPVGGEAHDEWMARCMASGPMMTEFGDSAQRLAVCTRMWQDHMREPKMMKILGAAFEVKQLDDRGSFEGLASVYGNTDLGDDIVEPGAFKEFALTRDGMIRILDGHNTRAPIGKGPVTDTHLGLALKGQLTMEVARAREVHALMKDHIIDGLSIGYDVLGGPGVGYEITEQDGKTVRKLKALKLWEVSLTPFPMNQAALVSAVKDIEAVRSVRELEALLRDAVVLPVGSGGKPERLSKAQATLHAGAIWKTLTGRRDADEGGVQDEVQQMVERIRKLV